MTAHNEYRCLAIQQPYAWAICAGIKNIENRTWTTKHRGQIVIVASSKTTEIKATQKAAKPRNLSAEHLTISAAIGVVDVVDVVPLNKELESNPWAFGPYCWLLDNAKLFAQPIPCKGKLNLYAPDPELAAQIAQQLPHARPLALDDNGEAWRVAMSQRNPYEALVFHANNYEALQDWENLLRITESSFGNENEGHRLWFRALALFQTESDAEALTPISNLIDLEPDNPDAYNLRGQIYDVLDKEEEANADYASVVELCPDYYDQSETVEEDNEQ